VTVLRPVSTSSSRIGRTLVLFPKPVSGKVALPEPLRVDDRRRGNSFPTTGLTAGSEAHIMPVKTSMLDQMEAPTLSSGKCVRFNSLAGDGG